jgi:hypothetical protein
MQDKPPYPQISSMNTPQAPQEKRTIFQYSYPQQRESSLQGEKDNSDSSSDYTKTASIGRWSKEEHSKFIECIFIISAQSLWKELEKN